MLDAQNAFKSVDGEIDIHWGAYVGTDDEILVTGKLREVCDEIERLRNAAREKHGWIMDSYILTKPEAFGEE
jgi:precorrin-6A synthase